MASIYDIIETVGIGGLGENTRAAQAVYGKQQDIANQNIALTESAMPAALGVLGQKNQGELAAQEAGRAVSAGLGNDPNDPNSLLSILVQDFRENMFAAREQQAAIAAKQSVSMYDDVPQFLINQLTLPGDVRAYDATMGKAQVAKEGIAQMQALTTASAQAARATAQTMTKDSIKQQAEVDAATLTTKVNALKIDALGYDLEGIKIAGANNAQFVQYQMNMHQLRMQDAAAARASEEHQTRKAAIDKDKIEDQEYAKIINAGRASLELPAVNLDTIKMLRKSKEQSGKLDRFFNLGIDLAATGSNAIGSSAGDSIVNALETGGLKGAQNKASRDYLESIARDVAKTLPPKSTMTDLKNAVDDKLYGPFNAKTGKRDERLGELYKMASDVERPGSIYKAPELNVLAASPSIKSNPIYESVIAPAISAGITKSDPASMYAQGAEAIRRGIINEKQLAKGLADFYKSVTAVTYAHSGAGKFSLPYRPSYVSRVEDPTGLSPYQLDWTKESNWIMYHTSTQFAKAFTAGLPTGITPGVR